MVFFSMPLARLAPALLPVLLVTSGCGLFSSSGDPCEPQITVTPEPNGDKLKLPVNSAQRLTATVAVGAKCDTALPYDFEIAWTYDDDGDLAFSEAELAATINTNSFQIFACPADAGEHLLRITATPITEATRPKLTRNLTINIEQVSAAPKRPACFNDALQAIVTANDVNASTVKPLEDALGCIEPYLDNVNICDLQASYAAGLARFGTFNARTPEWIRTRSELTPQDVIDIFNDELIPMMNRFELIKAKGDESFQFVVDGTFNILATENNPDLEGDQAQFIVLQGVHDYTDAWAISSLNNAIRGVFEMLLSYQDLVQFLLDFPDLSELPSFQDFRKLFIGEVIDKPDFMNLTDDGPARLLRAQQNFVDFFVELERAVDLVRQETGLQYNHLFRYWDCGSDGICDCSRLDELVEGNPDTVVPTNNFLACPSDPALYEGPPDDGTENNRRYDAGEPVGTDRIGNSTQFSTVALPSDIKEFIAQNRVIRDNIRGPDELDLDALVSGVTGGVPIKVFLATILGLPIPEIRLSEWFVSPSNVRDILPIFSISDRDVVFDIESEPFDDTGYDDKGNEDEEIVHEDNPRGLELGEPYDAILNNDPSFDDLDPFCNPVCNASDDIDNNGNGLSDADDTWIFGGFSLNTDMGVENNLTFDWIDFNYNFRHDATEPSEPFEDVGVLNHRGELIGAGNGTWDFADQPHTFPEGADFGPFNDLDQTDPPNGTDGYLTEDGDGNPLPVPGDQEIRNSFGGDKIAGSQADYRGLYDSFYFFFPDPTFSGVLRFPEQIPSITGDMLTDNAKLTRFFSKLLEIAAVARGLGERRGDGLDVPPRAGFGNVCSDRDACLEAICKWQPDFPDCP